VASERVHELAAAYALGALDPAERRAFDEHLAGCEACRETVASLEQAAVSLAYAADGPEPPVELRERILQSARAERPKVVPLRQRWSPLQIAAVAAAACLVFGLGLWSTLGQGGGTLFPGPQRIALSGARGQLIIGRSGTAFLELTSLAPAPAGRAYEVWVIRSGHPVRAGVFARGGRDVIVELERKVPGDSTVAVTMERAGGVSQPTGKPLFSASVPA
jgi:anti-sigma-K factor RskA